MRRMNVQFAQIEECIRTALFAVDALPRNPSLEPGEPLLLQLVKSDATRIGKEKSRVEFALLFDRAVEDRTGERSRTHWPRAGKVWRYILECRETIPTIPFSLEDLGLSRDYGGQANPQYIQPSDAQLIAPYLKGIAPAAELPAVAGVLGLLAAIRNYDTIAKLEPQRLSHVREHDRVLRDPWLSDALKGLYDHKCQICTRDFKPRYGIAYANTRFLTRLETSRRVSSKNLVVVCPNHDAILGATQASYDAKMMAFSYPNGLVERVMLRDHLLE
jgi:hypothetical protein